MPQMAPMNWIFLFTYFNFGLYLSFSKMLHLSNWMVILAPSSQELKGAQQPALLI